MVKAIKKDFLLKLVALLISLGLWLHVQLSKPQVAQELFSFEVKVVNLDRSKFAITRLSADVVRLRASGTAEELRKVKGRTFAAYVDLMDAEPGLKEYRLQANYPTDVNIEWERSPTVFVNVEPLAHDLHKVAVVQDESNAPTGFTLGDPGIEPEMVRIEGPESRLELVAKVRAVLIPDKPLKPGMKFMVPLEFLDKNNKVIPGVTADRDEVQVTPTLIPLLQRHSFLVIPSFEGQPAFGYQVDAIEVAPNQVDFTGDDRRLSRVTTVRTLPINLAGLTESRSFEVRLQPVDGGAPKRGAVTVRVRISKTPVPPTEPPNLGTP